MVRLGVILITTKGRRPRRGNAQSQGCRATWLSRIPFCFPPRDMGENGPRLPGDPCRRTLDPTAVTFTVERVADPGAGAECALGTEQLRCLAFRFTLG